MAFIGSSLGDSTVVEVSSNSRSLGAAVPAPSLVSSLVSSFGWEVVVSGWFWACIKGNIVMTGVVVVGIATTSLSTGSGGTMSTVDISDRVSSTGGGMVVTSGWFGIAAPDPAPNLALPRRVYLEGLGVALRRNGFGLGLLVVV